MSDLTSSDLARVDASGVTREHWKIMFIPRISFFTDGHDLFIIGVAMHLIQDEWHSPAAGRRPGDIDGVSVPGLLVTVVDAAGDEAANAGGAEPSHRAGALDHLSRKGLPPGA
jgi:hypothetical protein